MAPQESAGVIAVEASDEPRASAAEAVPVVALGLALLFVLGRALPVRLELARPTLAALFLANASHVSWDQVLYAGLPAALFAVGTERALGPWRTLGVVLGSALAVSLAVLALERGRLEVYSGSSGVGHALAATLALRGLDRRAGLGLLGLLAAKVAFELAAGRLVCDVGLEAAGVVPVPFAHAAGVASGVVLALGLSRERGQA